MGSPADGGPRVDAHADAAPGVNTDAGTVVVADGGGDGRRGDAATVKPVTSGSGCGCAAGPPGAARERGAAAALLVLGAALALARRARRPGRPDRRAR
jgi:MYXO-CTERM domain-containing protein